MQLQIARRNPKARQKMLEKLEGITICGEQILNLDKKDLLVALAIIAPQLLRIKQKILTPKYGD